VLQLTLLPDFLFRRFVQGKRLGKEITLFSVWYELRWGITLCLILTVLLITVVLYNHPSSKDVNALFRTISIFAETGGRVSRSMSAITEGEEGPAAVQDRQ
jgi:hypothetical protein